MTSSATVSPPSVATVQPAFGVWVTITSPGPSGTGVPSTVTVAVPAVRRVSARAAASALVIAFATAGVCLPNRRPSALKFGFTE